MHKTSTRSLLGPPADVHSPFVHLFTTSLPSPETSRKVLAASHIPAPATWTPLDPEKDSESLWACKARRFWPVRVVLEGNAPPPPAISAQPEAFSDDRARRRKRRDTFQREVDLDEEIRERERKEALELLQNTDTNAVSSATIKSQIRAIKVDTSVTAKVASPATGDEAQSPSTPTILESVRQLGQSVAANLGPAVQQLPTTMHKSISELRDWFAQRQLPSPFEDEVEAEEERRRREKRRRRRERRCREAEAAEANSRAESERDSWEANDDGGTRNGGRRQA